MYVAEIWRYPVKSLRGEQLTEAAVSELGIQGDRRVMVVSAARGRVITARTRPKLLGLAGTTDSTGIPLVNGHQWNSPEARELVEAAAGEPVSLVEVTDDASFDVLPLLVSTDGAIAEIHVDRRRFRPNILIGDVRGRTEREWPGKTLRIGGVQIQAERLRPRCVMTTYDPDTLKQDPSVLKRIVTEFDGVLALDSSVLKGGRIAVGDSVEILENA